MFVGSNLWRRISLCAVGLLCAWPSPSTRGESIVYSGGHGDIGLQYVNGELDFRFRFDSTATLNGTPRGSRPDKYSPEEVVVLADKNSYNERFTDAFQALLGTTSAFSFGYSNSRINPYLGIAAQDSTLPTTEWIDPDPALGWSTWLGRMQLEITGVNYVGDADDAEFALFSYGASSGAVPVYSTFTGASKEIVMPMPGHGHYEWAFSAVGTYEVALKAWGTHVIDGYKETETTIRFQIQSVPEPSAIALAGLGFGVVLLHLRRKSSDPRRRDAATA